MILVIGDVMTDVIVRPLGAPAPGTDQAASIVTRFGGSGANIACWLGHGGTPTRFAGRVGSADVATHVAAFATHGVEAALAGDATRGTGTVVAVLGEAGARGFFTDRAANLGLGAADLPDSLLEGVAALHVSGHVFFTDGPRDAARRLMGVAVAAGIAVSIDAGSAGWLKSAGEAAFRDWTEDAALCFANADEAALLGAGYDEMVVTLGAAGAEWRQDGANVAVPAQATTVHDGTGAGDAFTAGFLAARMAGLRTMDCLLAGSKRAAECVVLPGGRPCFPSTND